jgi:hypothetical protein
MKKYFLQFYREEDFLYGNERFVNFNNGLSYVWDQIKEQGEIVWREVDDESLVATEGEIYASVWYTKNLRLLYNWAKTYPDLQVYACGPLVLHYGISLGKELSNFHVSNANAEDLLCNGKISSWNLEIINTDKPIGYSVSLVDGYGCYWGKCRYCKITGKLKYRDIDEVPVIEHPNKKFIWLHVYSLSPNFMEKLYSKFEDRNDVVYATYVRGDKYITKALIDTLPKLKVDPRYLAFNMGVEFPSDKMLKYMDKGATVSEYLEFIKVCCDNRIRLHFNFILGWKGTDYSDVKSVEYFLNEISKFSTPNTITANVYPLSLVADRKIMSDYTVDEIVALPTDYDILVASPILTPTQIYFDNEIRKLFYSFPFLNLHDWTVNKEHHKKIHYGLK